MDPDGGDIDGCEMKRGNETKNTVNIARIMYGCRDVCRQLSEIYLCNVK